MIKLAGRRFWFWRYSPSGMDYTPEGKQIVVEGKKEKHYGVIAFEADRVSLPVIEEDGHKTMVPASDLSLVGKEKEARKGRLKLALAGKGVKFQRKAPDVTKMSKDGDERIIEGKLSWVNATISPEVFDVYLPVVLDENKEKNRVKSRELVLVRE